MIENTDPHPLHPNPLIAATMAADAAEAERFRFSRSYSCGTEEEDLMDATMAADAAEAEVLEVLESPCEEMIFDLAAQIRLLEDEISHRQARQLDRIEQQVSRLWDAMKQLTSDGASK